MGQTFLKNISQMTNKCNYCGNTQFQQPAWRDWSCPNAECIVCFSTERHRSLKKVLDEHKEQFNNLSLLHLSDEPFIEQYIYPWFGKTETSIYGVSNSIDIQKINRRDHSYDVIFCNHVLEHVENDTTAIKELLRILKVCGMLFITVPNPVMYKETKDWGFPDSTNHDHYRIYGRDLVYKLDETVGSTGKVKAYKVEDPITGVKDIVYKITKNNI